MTKQNALIENKRSLPEIQDVFIQHWGDMGTLWGINKAMGQLHALLLTAKDSLSVDEMMARLNMSRGNVSMNIRELVHWGVVHKVYRKGDRKSYFVAEANMWKVLERILRERKKRELEPTADCIQQCLRDLAGYESEEEAAFKARLAMMNSVIDVVNSTADYMLSSSRIDPKKLLEMLQAVLSLKKQ